MKYTLDVLLTDDDPEVLNQLMALLPNEFRGYALSWEPCGDFDESLVRIQSRRYDLVVTDVYRDQHGHKKGTETGTAKGVINIDAIRGKRFCPVIAFSDGSMPDGFKLGPFTRFADKSPGDKHILEELGHIFDTGIPQVANKLHSELDGVGSNYLWDFLEIKWPQLVSSGCTTPEILERLVRRRAATVLGRLNSSGNEVNDIAGVEFYIYPKINPGELRLGEILRERSTGNYRIILTPHCLLTIQTNQQKKEVAGITMSPKPKAEYVMTIKTVMAGPLLAKYYEGKTISEEQLAKEKKVRSVIGSNPSLGETPEGRYWFLPRFLDMPDLYCDFLQIESLPFSELDPTTGTRFDAVAVLDAPFAEALQARFGEFYASVGTPNLHPKHFFHLLPTPAPVISTSSAKK